MSYKWKPSKTKAREFAQQMEQIENYCDEHGIYCSTSMDSYYFTVDSQKYRVSNHTIEASNRHAYNWAGEQVRQKYHDDKRDENTIYIMASKTRLIKIHQNLLAGKILDGRGNIKTTAK